MSSTDNEHLSIWSYNDRNELTGSARREGNNPGSPGDPVDDEQFAYDYDPIGNRTEYEEGTPAVTTDYLSNVLNQYEYLGTDADKPSAQNLAHDADGNLVEAFIVADMNCDGALNSYDIDPFVLALTDPDEYEQQYPDCDIMNADVNGDGVVDSFDSTAFSAMLASGNTATWLVYEWNAENRLTAVIPQAPQAGDKKVEFAYDYMGRRVRKQVYEWDGSEWDLIADTKFVWAGWLLLLELDALDQDAVVRKYTWGLDLSQSLGGAGGIGGLLAVYDDAEEEDYVYLYDANGNVGQLVAWASGFGGATGDEWHADRLVAHYEYDPYANIVNQTGPYAEDNPFRFSTKYWDDETGLGYWGERYYSPRTGRWLSRDPIEERGDAHLYRFVRGEPLSRVDPLGRRPCWCCKPGDTCAGDVEAAFVASRNKNPDQYKPAALIAFSIAALGAGFEAPCVLTSVETVEIAVGFGHLVAAMKDKNTGSIWTRYQCKECVSKKRAVSRPWWAWIVAPDIGWYRCTVWEPMEKTKWKRCTEKLGNVEIGMHGLRDEDRDKLTKKCVQAAAEDAEAACGDPCP